MKASKSLCPQRTAGNLTAKTNEYATVCALDWQTEARRGLLKRLIRREKGLTARLPSEPFSRYTCAHLVTLG
jgi:hypothetical protein